MRKTLFTAILALSLSGVVYAGTIVIDFGSPVTITTTAAQNAKLTRALADYNSGRVANGQAAVSMENFLKAAIVAGVLTLTEQAAANEQAEACQAYKTGSAALRSQIDAALGGKSPCR